MTKVKTIRLDQKDIVDFSDARKKLIDSSYDWNLFLDSDEELSRPLPPLDKKYNYAFKRDDWFLGRRLKFGETANVILTRLIQPGTGRWVGQVHERFESQLPVKLLRVRLWHRRKLGINEFIDRLNWYSSLRADEIKDFSAFKLLFYPVLKFIRNYIFLLGFLDGVPGLMMAWLMSLHSLAVRVKVYEKTR